MRDIRQKNRARVLIERPNFPAPLAVVDVGVMTTVVMTTTVLLASSVVVWDKELTISDVVDETVDVDIELVVVEISLDWIDVEDVEEEAEEAVVMESEVEG